MVSSLLRCREKIGMTLLGVGIFYFLALAGTFADSAEQADDITLLGFKLVRLQNVK